MSGSADLFVVCKNCGSEVSPYVTECPYCGQRVRKRAPKLDRGGVAREPLRPAARRTAPPRLGRLRPGEIPGVRADATRRPYVTLALVGACFVVYLLAVAGAVNELDLVVVGKLHGDWWRPFSAPFVHGGGGVTFFSGGAYQFATMVGVGVFGWLLERRHGPWVVGVLYLLAGAGGMLAAAALGGDNVAIGSNGLALGLLCAWAIPDVLAWRNGEDWEGDLLGTAAIAAVLLLMPLAVREASPVAGVVGAVVGLLVGLPLARISER